MPGCHLGPDARQGLRLEVDQIYRSSVNVRARTDRPLLRVVPGAADESLLYLKLLPPDEGHYRGPRMPLSMNPLSADEIALVRQWVEAFPADRWGAPPAAEAAARPPRTFHDSTLVNLPTSDPLGGRTLEFRILHRFKAPAREAGSHDFYGLDTDAWVSIGLAYGLGDTVEVGLRRTNLQHDYEAYSKWVPIRQVPGRAPLSLALRGSFSNLRETTGFNRNRYGAQAILARRLGDHLSLMLVPTYVTRTNYLDEADTRGTSTIGVGGEWRLNPKMAVTGEWIGRLQHRHGPSRVSHLRDEHPGRPHRPVRHRGRSGPARRRLPPRLQHLAHLHATLDPGCRSWSGRCRSPWRLRGILVTYRPHSAEVAELADALDSGSSGGNPVQVQVLSSAPTGS